MKNFTLSTDSGCDEFKNNLTKMDIHYIPLAYIDGETTYLDDFTCIEDYIFFYNELKKGKMYKTAGLNPYDLEEYFNKLLEDGKDIVHISLSSGISGTCEIAQNVARALNDTHTNKIYIIDSKSATGGENLVLGAARKLRDENKTALEAVHELETIVKRLNFGFFVGNLEHLKRGGRISPLSATIGKMLQLKPILEFDRDGKLQVIDKVIGSKKAIMKLADRISVNGIKDNTPIYITHSGNYELVAELKELLETKIENPNIIVTFVGPVIASHTGPELLTLVFQENI